MTTMMRTRTSTTAIITTITTATTPTRCSSELGRGDARRSSPRPRSAGLPRTRSRTRENYGMVLRCQGLSWRTPRTARGFTLTTCPGETGYPRPARRDGHGPHLRDRLEAERTGTSPRCSARRTKEAADGNRFPMYVFTGFLDVRQDEIHSGDAGGSERFNSGEKHAAARAARRARRNMTSPVYPEPECLSRDDRTMTNVTPEEFLDSLSQKAPLPSALWPS